MTRDEGGYQMSTIFRRFITAGNQSSGKPACDVVSDEGHSLRKIHKWRIQTVTVKKRILGYDQ